MKTVRARVLASTFLAGTILFAGSAHAQAQPATTDADAATAAPTDAAAPAVADAVAPSQPAAPAKEIVITGSRIPQPNLTSASPVTVLSSQDVKLQGTTRTEDLINSLPQAFASQGSNISNGATGAASVDLRGMGSTRTLVLVNGRRLMGGDPTDPTADINFVPAALIKRVDVLTGGASSVYGADAVAGVVNFIMDTNFTGLRIDAQAGTFMHYNETNDGLLAANAARGFRPPHGWSTNGGAQDISAAFGTNFDDNRGHIMAYATYRKQDPVLEASRDYSFCSTAALRDSLAGPNNDVNDLGRLFNCGGSGTSANGSFFRGSGGTFTVGPNGTFVPSNSTTNPPFNFAPYNYFQRPDERYTFGAFAEYEISPGAKPYLETMFMDDRSVAAVAPSGDFANTFDINCDNPLLSAQQLSVMCIPANTFVDANGVTRANVVIARRNVEGGPRLDDRQHTAYRLVGGVRGDLLRGLSYDAYYQYGKTIFADTFLNDMSLTKMIRALDVVDDPSQPGTNPICRSVLTGLDASCVPWNIFTSGGVTQAALDYIQTPGIQRGDVGETVANLNVTLEGDEYGLQMPWSDRGIGLNVGGEYRKEALALQVDEAFASGDLTGQGGPTPNTKGSFDVRELFAEVALPIIRHSFIDEFTLSAGYRYSDYKVAGSHFSTDTYKLSVELAPVRDVRLRGSYNRAVRAPNVVELFQPVVVGLDGSADPCAGTTPAATLAQCQLTGVTAAQYGSIVDTPGGQYNSLSGGNPDLRPEVADSYTLGTVLQPRFIPGLALTVDYFDIRLKGAISTIGFDTIMNQCITTADPFFCSRIRRQAGTGSLWFFVSDINNGGYIVDVNTNVGGIRTTGIDVNGTYSRRIGGLGNLSLNFVGTYADRAEFSPLKGIAYDCAGFYGGQCGIPRPKWRHKFRAGITFKNGIGISGQWRHFSSVENDIRSDDPDLNAPDIFPGNSKVAAQNYFDLTLSARLADRFSFRLGANNILDREPPIMGSTTPVGGSAPGGATSNGPLGNGNTYPQVYDALGRFLFAGVTIDF